MKEAKLPLLAAVMAGFGGVISEVGASIMVGGNIKGYSRVLTTATVMETGRGNFDVAIALSIILLLLAYRDQPGAHPDPAEGETQVSMPVPIYEAKNLQVVRGGSLILNVKELKVPDGEILSLIGANGAGKSTLLQTLAALVRPSRGEVFFRGRRIGAEIPCSPTAEGLPWCCRNRFSSTRRSSTMWRAA